jgi:hypothetical protein
MRKLIYALAVSALPALGASSARAQTVFADVDRATAAQLERIVSDAGARGLPTERIVAKARHGVMMKVPAPRIVAAAEAVATRLEQARDVLAPSPSDVDIMAGEDALSVGVSAAALRLIRSASPTRSVAVPIGVLAQLVANHVSQERATNIVLDLVRHGISNRQLVDLGNDVNADVALGGNPDNSLDIRLRGLAPLLGPSVGVEATAPVTATSGSASPPGRKKP